MRHRAAHAGWAAWLGLLALAALLLSAPVAAQTGAAPKGNPRLASLRIEIWPEFDRPAALVILNAALAEGVKLPAAVTLRLPAASGGATAVAYSATADGNLLNLKNERSTTGEFVTLKFDVPERFFHVEFYEPIATTASARTYTYVWPGDLAVERLTVTIQEPASATDISVEPNLEGVSTGENGLRYRGAELGALEPGKRLPIAVRYTKTDARPSAEILKPKAAPVVPPLAAPPPSPPATGGLPDWALPVAGAAILGLLGAVFILWRWKRESRPASPVVSVCAKCGAARTPGARFCANCGAKVA